MQIRQAAHTDLDGIMRVVRLVVPLMQATGNHQWDNEYPERAAFTSDLDNGELWVTEADNQVVAVAAICGHQSPEYASVGWDLTEPAIVVHRLAVDPAVRGQGIALALMQQAEQVAREQQIPRLRLDTNTKNLAVQALLVKLGYEYAGEISLLRRPALRFRCYEKLI
jgi:ribosomal protein S18 acetylase RimI-like enzyme